MRYFKLEWCLVLPFILGVLGIGETWSQTPFAHAYPMEAITVDGTLGDWPPAMNRYDIHARPYDDPLSGPEDFKGYFQVGYHQEKNTLFFALVIEDDSHVIDESTDASWTSHDTYTFYLDAKHDKQGSGVQKYSFSTHFREMGKAHLSWDPALLDLQDWSKLDYAIQHHGRQTMVEFSFRPELPVEAYSVFGIDFLVLDKDTGDHGNTMMAWVDSHYKERDFGKIGQLLLLPSNNVPLEPLQAQIKLPHGSKDMLPHRVRLESLSNPDLWLWADISDSGSMEVQLPKGDYLMELWDPIVREGRRFFKLKVNRRDNTVATGRDITENTLMLELDQMVHQMPSKGVLLDGMDQNLERQIDSFVKSYLDTYNIPGVSLALIDKGKVAYYQTYGVQNNYTREPVNNRTRFEAASITKPFFAFAVLRLSERGFIELDRPLYQYLKLPEDIQEDPRAKKLTARIVLSHSTGLPNWPWLTDNGKLAIQYEPGSTYTYSGAGYGYLQEVIESITGKDIVTVLQEEVIDVLVIENTYFEYRPFLLRNTSVGHNDGGIPHANDIRPTAHVASSMITDAESLSKFFIQILDRKGLQKATYDDFFKLHTMTNPETAPEEGNHYFGLGLYFEETPFGLSFGHSGNNGDFKCDAVIFEDLGKGFVLLTNNGYGDALLYDLYDFLFYGNKKP